MVQKLSLASVVPRFLSFWCCNTVTAWICSRARSALTVEKRMKIVEEGLY